MGPAPRTKVGVCMQETCPLCVEELDETDKDFYPCQCGYAAAWLPCTGVGLGDLVLNPGLLRYVCGVCRYQVCLFCYEKVKEKCNALCPGCRREYGAPVEAPMVAKSEDRSMEASRSSSGILLIPRPSTGASYSGTSLQSAVSAPPPLQAGRSTAAANKPSDVLTAQQRRAQDAQQTGGRRAELGGVALPTGATWAAPGAQATPRPALGIGEPEQRQATGTAAATSAVDTSAWPSLAAAAAPPVVQRQQERQQYHHQRHDHSHGSGDTSSIADSQHHRSASGSSASAEGMHSRTSSSQDLSQQDASSHQQLATSTSAGTHLHVVPPHLVDAFSAAQVSSMVHGVRHNINVPLTVTGSQVPALPDAPALKSSLQEAVKAGTVCSKEAAARLLSLLRQNGAAASTTAPVPTLGAAGGPVRSQLAAGRPPPGFGLSALQGQPTALPPALLHLGGPLTPPLNNSDPSIIRPPLGKFQPIQPPLVFGGTAAAPGRPLQPPGMVAQPVTSTSAVADPSHHHQQQQQQQQQQQLQLGNGTYSLWSGLPGLELGVGQPVGWQAPPGFGPGLQPGGGLGAAGFPAPSAATTPPPGFGPAAYASMSRPPGFGGPLASAGSGGDGATTAASGEGGGASLLQAQLAGLSRPPPPGMAAYRPALA